MIHSVSARSHSPIHVRRWGFYCQFFEVWFTSKNFINYEKLFQKIITNIFHQMGFIWFSYKKTSLFNWDVFKIKNLVEFVGFKPATFWMQIRCSINWTKTPKIGNWTKNCTLDLLGMNQPLYLTELFSCNG